MCKSTNGLSIRGSKPSSRHPQTALLQPRPARHRAAEGATTGRSTKGREEQPGPEKNPQIFSQGFLWGKSTGRIRGFNGN